ncbi:MAG: CHAD domain-containing protein [Gammaproteobacteria bacterium]|nr:CHAD domain-containing protein [Gammaproteobacteria bacterium]
MTDLPQHGFLLPQAMSVDRLAALLGGDGACDVDDSAAFSLRFFDSFDWRLYGAGLTLLQLNVAQDSELRLKPVDGAEVLDAAAFDGTPQWPAELPPGALHDRVAELLDMRVLLPIVEVQGTATDLRVLNDDAKTVARLQYLSMNSHAPSVDEPRSLWPRVRLLPVKGYDSALDELARFFAADQEWPAAPACLLDEAVAAIGREPGDYSSKLDVSLKPDMPALDAMRKIFLTLLDTLERNVDGTRANLDSEFLHDLRVATRRTRSALSQVKRVLPDAIVDEYKQRFAWVGQITGQTRDLDVFLLELPRYRDSLPAAMRGDLDLLQRRLEDAHVDAQRTLADALDSAPFRALLRDWRRVLEAESLPGEPGWFADLPIKRVVSQRIWRLYRRVIKDGRAAVHSGEPLAMHELRKDCKKLRYLIEFFRSLYDPRLLKGTVKTLKALLDNLGEFQDKEVQALHLRELAAGFDLGDAAVLPNVLAIGALAADSLRAQEAAHGRFSDCFATFDSPRNRERYKALFKSPGGSTR